MTDITPSLSDYPYQVTLPTRWQDNDIYGNVNNVVFYSFFDTAVNRFLADEACMDFRHSPVIAHVVSSQCQFISNISYPEDVEVGVRVAKIGRSSVTYGVSIYAGTNQRRVAHGQFVQVFVDRTTNRVVQIPPRIKSALERIIEAL